MLIDLSQIAAPDIISPVDYEAIRSAMLADLKARLQAVGIDFDVDGLETDTLVINEEARSYRELIVLQRINDAVRAVLLPSAAGTDLEQLASDFNLERRVITPAVGDTPAVMETDSALRTRRQLAPEGYAVAGPEDAYRFHAMMADASIKEVRAYKGDDNRVTVVLLSRDGNGAVPVDVVAVVHDALSPTSVRPLTDSLYTRSAEIVEAAVAVRIEIGAGPDAAAIEAKALAGLTAHVATRHRIGAPLYLDGLIGAAREAKPVERVTVTSPVADIDPGQFGAVYVTSIAVEVVRV